MHRLAAPLMLSALLLAAGPATAQLAPKRPKAPTLKLPSRAQAKAAAKARRAKQARAAKAAARRTVTRRRVGATVTTILPTQAVRGRIAKPQVTFFLARRAPSFQPWITANGPVHLQRR